jgi:hypothetical protein
MLILQVQFVIPAKAGIQCVCEAALSAGCKSLS